MFKSNSGQDYNPRTGSYLPFVMSGGFKHNSFNNTKKCPDVLLFLLTEPFVYCFKNNLSSYLLFCYLLYSYIANSLILNNEYNIQI